MDGSDEIHMDKSELKYAEWISRDEIVLQPQDISLTNEMMVVFREGREPVGYLYRQCGEMPHNKDQDE